MMMSLDAGDDDEDDVVPLAPASTSGSSPLSWWRRLIVWIEVRPVTSFLLCFVPCVAFLVVLNAAVEASEPYVHHDAVSLTFRVRTYGSGVVSVVENVYGKRTTLAALARNGFGRTATTGDDWQLLWTLNPQIRHILPVVDEENVGGVLRPLPTRAVQGGEHALRPRIHNHCFFFLAAGQKCQFASHLIALRRRLGELNAMDAHLDVYRWRVADDQARLLRAFNDPSRPMFVQKACTMSRGRGIDFVRRPAERGFVALDDPIFPVANGSFVFQRNIDRPMLLDGHKFHVRVYLLVTSYHPVRISLFDEGLVFKAFKRVTGAKASDRDAMLSNRAVSGSQSDNFLSWFWTQVGAERSARMRTRIRRALVQLVALYVPISAPLQQVGTLDIYPPDWRVTADIDAHVANSTANKLGCFDLFGVDIMFDEDDNPAILEINAGPSMDSPSLAPRPDGSAALDDDDEQTYIAHDATFDANNAVKRRMLTNAVSLARRFVDGVRVARTTRHMSDVPPLVSYAECMNSHSVGGRTVFCSLLRRFRQARCDGARDAEAATPEECSSEIESMLATLYHYREHAMHRATPLAPHFDWFPERAAAARKGAAAAADEGAVNGFTVVYPTGDDVDASMYDVWTAKNIAPFSSLDVVQMDWAQFLHRTQEQ
jgi:hypothetical protein